jgi:hypothetical protein
LLKRTTETKNFLPVLITFSAQTQSKRVRMLHTLFLTLSLSLSLSLFISLALESFFHDKPVYVSVFLSCSLCLSFFAHVL